MKQGNRSHPGCPEHIRAGRAPRTSAASMPRWVHSARVPEAGLSGYSWQSPGRTPGRLLTVTPNCAAGLRITLPPSSRSSLDPDGEIARQPRLLALPPRTMESINEIASANSPSEQRHLPHPQLGPTRIQSAGREPIGANQNQSTTSSPPCTNEPLRNYRDCPSGGKVSIQRGRSTRAYEKKGGKCKQGVARHGRLSNIPYRKSLSAQREKRPLWHPVNSGQWQLKI